MGSSIQWILRYQNTFGQQNNNTDLGSTRATTQFKIRGREFYSDDTLKSIFVSTAGERLEKQVTCMKASSCTCITISGRV